MNTLIAEVLAAWREAERLATTADAQQDRERARVAASRLRDLYQELDGQELVDESTLRTALERFRVHPAGS